MIYLYLFGTCFHFIYVFMIIGNNSLWVVVTVMIEVYNDVIIKYFILICFLVTSLGEIDLFLSSEFEARKNAQYYGLMIVYQ